MTFVDYLPLLGYEVLLSAAGAVVIMAVARIVLGKWWER